MRQEQLHFWTSHFGPVSYRHVHIAAMLLALLLPALLQFRHRERIRLFAGAALIASVVGVYMAGSTAWVALILVALATIIIRVRIRAAVIAGPLAALAGLVILALAGALGATVSRLQTTFTLTIRAETWVSALAASAAASSHGMGSWVVRCGFQVPAGSADITRSWRPCA